MNIEDTDSVEQPVSLAGEAEEVQQQEEQPIEQDAQEAETPEAAQEQAEEAPKLTPEQNELFDKKFRKKSAKWLQREAEQKARADKAEQELAALRKQFQQTQAPAEPVVPPMPDPYAADFNEKVREREAALVKKAQYDAEQRVIEAQKQAAEEARLQQQQTELMQAVTAYSDRAVKMGINETDLQTAGNYVQGYVSPDVASIILSDDIGPAITMYLAENPEELVTIGSMQPAAAAYHIASTVKPKVGKVAKKQTRAPAPTEPLGSGGGVGSAVDKSTALGIKYL